MGQNSSSTLIKDYISPIETKDGKTFKMTYHALVEHIFLLRKVIKHPEVTKEGPVLDNLIKNYCKRMAQGEMRTADQQSELPWQIEWIWHVHRLHPLDYLNDCEKQLSDGLVDKKATQLIQNRKEKSRSKMMMFPVDNNHSLFVPSIDLTSAVIRQNAFLKKFEKHFLYSCDLQKFGELRYQNLVQNYVSFVKLARKGQMIVPKFDIDLIWHTHMRYPSDYHKFSTDLRGFVLNHVDSIEKSALMDAYQETAARWKQTYKSEYGANVDRKHLLISRYRSSCAMVFAPVFSSTSTERSTRPAASCTYIDDSVDIGDNTGGCASAEYGDGNTGGCDDSGGGDDGGGCGGGCGGD
jgi:hypothetical protein